MWVIPSGENRSQESWVGVRVVVWRFGAGIGVGGLKLLQLRLAPGDEIPIGTICPGLQGKDASLEFGLGLGSADSGLQP